jgi:hypothetical protein
MTEKRIDAFAQDIIDTYTFASKSSQNETDFQKFLYSHLEKQIRGHYPTLGQSLDRHIKHIKEVIECVLEADC